LKYSGKAVGGRCNETVNTVCSRRAAVHTPVLIRCFRAFGNLKTGRP
jgi:hypothetical protein